jgi:hypothetical protein
MSGWALIPVLKPDTSNFQASLTTGNCEIFHARESVLLLWYSEFRSQETGEKRGERLF